MRNFNNYLELEGYENLFNVFKNLLKMNKLPQKILLSGQGGSGKFTFAFHFINFYFSQNESFRYDENSFRINPENKSFTLIKNGSHPNFQIIDLLENKKFIEIDQIREIIKYSYKSSLNNSKRFIIIDNAELLNLNASNALLKIIEEPNDNLYFILIHNNSHKILNTLKSRCIIFKKNFSHDQTIKIVENKINKKINDLVDQSYLKYYFSIGDLLFLINFANQNNLDLKNIKNIKLLIYLISKKEYKKNKIILFFMFKLIQCYFYEVYFRNKDNNFYNQYSLFIKKINQSVKYNLDLETLFYEFENNFLYE